MKQRQMLILTLILATAFLVACGGAAAEPAQPETVTLDVVANDIYFGGDPDNIGDPPVWTAEAGSTATINFTNSGAMEHNWAVVALGEEIPVPFVIEENRDLLLYDTGLVPAGEERTFAFRVPQEAGEYTVICTVAGHYPSMQGRLIVN